MPNSITETVMKNIYAMTKGLLNQYHDKIDKAFYDNEDSLDVSIKIKLNRVEGGIQVRTGLSFVESRIKDTKEFIIDPSQLQLFSEDQ
nr:hypothetical protein 5 [Dehalococcoidia bacterium]